MNTESLESRPPQRHQLALESLSESISLLELAHMLVLACEEAVADGKDPETDPAVALISGRIGFASPADVMSSDGWQRLVDVCENNVEAKIELCPSVVQ